MTRQSPVAAMIFGIVIMLSACAGEKLDNPDATADSVTGDTNVTIDADADAADTLTCPTPPTANFDYGVPLDPTSPWPKFRRDAAQTAAAPFSLCDNGAQPWRFKTGKGIFSSPVVAADGTIYIGSADRTFYALKADGTELWHFDTGEIIDSAALLDDKGRIYFGSGDGYLYALNSLTGKEIWRFLADDPSERDSYIRWFEGNVAIAPDGTLVMGNDNWFIYGINRDTGKTAWRFETPDQTWSLPAIDAKTGDIYIGNNNVLLPELLGNVFALDNEGKQRWMAGTLGTVAASPLLIEGGPLVLGAFDGFIHALKTDDGTTAWKVDTRDHVYASAALHPDGFVVVPSTDGTVYAINPDDGSRRWAFDWGNPIRSSPAIDGDGNIYMGTGDGKLLVLNADGTLRWALKLIEEDRDDLNASPALGYTAIYIAGENGEIFGVPFDFCLRTAEATNPACQLGPGEPLSADGAFLLFTTRFGSTLVDPPAEIEAHEPMAFSIVVREEGDTILALIDTGSLTVTAEPATELEIQVSAARQFLLVYPKTPLVADDEGNVSLTIKGDYLINPERTGLKFDGGTVGGQFSKTFTFHLASGREGPIPLPVPQNPGDPAGLWQMSRLAAPLPTILPSYNQIGFDSHHFLIGLVEGNDTRAIAYGLEVLPGPGDSLIAIPETSAVMVFDVKYNQGRIDFENSKGFSMGIQGTTIPFNLFRIAGALDESGAAQKGATIQAVTTCEDIPFYGAFLQSFGFCNPDTDQLVAWGAVLLNPFKGGSQTAPTGLGSVSFSATASSLTATLTGSTLLAAEHTFGILLVDTATGSPVWMDYGKLLSRTVDGDGKPATVVLNFDRAKVPNQVRAYLMVDTYPAWRETVDIPAE